MTVHINGSKGKELYYNGVKIKEAYYNGNKVYSSGPLYCCYRDNPYGGYIYYYSKYNGNSCPPGETVYTKGVYDYSQVTSSSELTNSFVSQVTMPRYTAGDLYT